MSQKVSLVTGQAFAPGPVSRSYEVCRRSCCWSPYMCAKNRNCGCHLVVDPVVRTAEEIVAEWDAMTNGGQA